MTDEPLHPVVRGARLALARDAWDEALAAGDVEEADRLAAEVARLERRQCGCGHPPADHDAAGACMHLCDCAWT
jgi:hypothetical protein